MPVKGAGGKKRKRGQRRIQVTVAAAVRTRGDQSEYERQVRERGKIDELRARCAAVVKRTERAHQTERQKRKCGKPERRPELEDALETSRRYAAARGSRDHLDASPRQGVGDRGKAELEEKERAQRRCCPCHRTGAGPAGRPLRQSLENGDRGGGRDPHPRLGRGHASKGREQGGELHPPAHRRQRTCCEQGGEQRLDNSRT